MTDIHDKYVKTLNVLASGCRGCYIAHDQELKPIPWIVGSKRIDLEASVISEDMDKIYVDVDDNGLLQIYNLCSETSRAIYLTLMYDPKQVDKRVNLTTYNGEILEGAITTVPEYIQEDPKEEIDDTIRMLQHTNLTHCTTIVLVAKPATGYDIGYVNKDDWNNDSLFPFVLDFEVKSHPAMNDQAKQRMQPQSVTEMINDLSLNEKGKYDPIKLDNFPLQTCATQTKFLCTQGFGGGLTHFFPESLYAIDLRCDNNTVILAVFDGIITDKTQNNSNTGIHCQNLGCWNSISIESSCGNYIADYVHIKPKSCNLPIGSKVSSGDPLCVSGNVGFVPEPHLHLEIHLKDASDGPSVPFYFVDKANSSFLPTAGKWYTSDGEV